MQRFRALASAKRSLPARHFLPASARFLSMHHGSARDDQSEVLVEGKASARAAILNRPAALNALNNNMVLRLKKLYESWEDNTDIGFVMLKGNGRAFSAGGDIVAIYRAINEGKLEHCKEFMRNVSMLIYIIGTYLKPHVAVLDGMTFGGGAGISIPGTFRIATDKTIFSTPEVHIGYHLDAGASFYLSHLTGHVGEYLALTGERLNGVDMIALGLATHYAMSARLDWIDHRLATLITDDPSVLDSSLSQYGDIVYPDKNSIIHRLDVIDKCFSHDTVEEILDALQTEVSRSNEEWCVSALNKLKKASPLSLKVSLRSVREARFQTLDECLVREYRLCLRAFSQDVSHDFTEGVRSRVIDKDLAPKWDPPSLDKVSEDMVDHYFSPLGESEPELQLPTHLREAFV